jgi:hypothetical protein
MMSAFCVAVLLSVVAFAGSAHFVGNPTFVISGSTISVSGKVAGLGNVPQIHVVISGTAQCVNPGDNKPKAANKLSVSGSGDFPVQNGRADFGVSATAVFQPSCDPPMTVIWSNLSVTVTADDGTYLVYP